MRKRYKYHIKYDKTKNECPYKKRYDYVDGLYKKYVNHVEKMLVEPILGKDYYNMAIDTDTCHMVIVEDLAKKYIEQSYENNKLKNIEHIHLFIIFILIIAIMCICTYAFK